MVDNNQHLNNGQPPFRRYQPPLNAGAANSNVAPLTPPPLSSPGGGPTTTSRGAKRRQRHARSRWRQWLQAEPGNPARSPNAPAGGRRSPSTARRAPGDPPARPPQPRIKNPLPASATPPQPSRPSYPGDPAAYRPYPADAAQWAGSPQTDAPGRSQPRQRQRPNNKVTPLRRRPAWTSADSPGSNAPPRRSKARRPGRKTPRPVLYGIRLLILGTGIAAIAGTILSSLNTGDEAALNNGNPGAAEVATGARSERGAALTEPLPLAEELVAVETELVALEAMTPGLTQSIFFYDLDTGNYIDLNGEETFAAASTIKVPILVAFLQAVDAGTIRLDQAVTLREELIAGGSGDLQTQEVGTQFTALEVATEMIVNSDNTATNMVIELLGGLEGLNQQFRSWGLTSTNMRNMLPDLEGTNTTSSADLVRVMALVDQGELLSPRSRDRLFGIMQRTVNRDLIPDGLADPAALTYNKTGDIGTLLGDVALVDVVNGNRYILSVLVDRPFNDGRASELIRRASGVVYEEMSQPVSPIGSGNPPAAAAEEAPESEAATDEVGAPAPEAVPYETEPATEVSPEPYVEPDAPFSNPELPPG